MIVVKNLHYSYNANNSFVFPDIICREADQWLIKGESGCGKTTFLHLVAGLLKPAVGEIVINNVDISKLAISEADKYIGNEIGIVFQKHHFIRSLNVAENLKLARYLVDRKITDKEVLDVLGRLHLDDKFKSPINSLSQGEQQRLSIARAVINAPSLLLADEPTSSLDDKHCKEAIELLCAEASRNNTILLVVTHDQRLSPLFENQLNLNTAKQ